MAMVIVMLVVVVGVMVVIRYPRPRHDDVLVTYLLGLGKKHQAMRNRSSTTCSISTNAFAGSSSDRACVKSESRSVVRGGAMLSRQPPHAHLMVV